MSRARVTREKNMVAKLVKTLNKRMEDFETAVGELKIMKDSIEDLHDKVTAKEAENKAILSKLEANLKDNKSRILNEAAESVGKVIISKEELNELNEEVQKLKTVHKQSRENIDQVVDTKVEELIKHRLKLQELEHKAHIASLESQVENFKKEAINLEKTFERMSSELESQKQLTSKLAMANRPINNIPNNN